jgi:maleylpyruvate isomerase
MSPRYDRHHTTATLPWMREGTAHLLGIVGKLGDEAFAESSALPDWTRGHVIGHVARNA